MAGKGTPQKAKTPKMQLGLRAYILFQQRTINCGRVTRQRKGGLGF